MAPPPSWSLVGRAAELETIDLSRAAAVPGVVVRGPAGVGKSRLAREAIASAERDGAVVLWVQATASGASVPLGAFAAVLPTEVRCHDLLLLLKAATA